MVSKSAQNTPLRTSSFIVQKDSILNNELANNNKIPKAFMKPKAQPKAMPKGKKQPNTLKTEKLNQQINEKPSF